MIKILQIIFLAEVLSAFPQPRQGGPAAVCKQPLVEVTASPEVNKKMLRILDLSWQVESFEPGDWIGLYDGPLSKGKEPLFKVDVTSAQGWVKTGVPEGRVTTEPVFNRTCPKFWAAYWRLNFDAPVTTNCLGTNPRWMEESRRIIGNLQLRYTFLPGTHNSGSFILSTVPFSENRYQKYVYTQDETILEQLLHGARFLDLRIGHYKDKKAEFWINHDIFRVHPFEFAIKDLKTFLDNTNEIVVLDFHRFPVGFKKIEVHRKFVAYLKSELSRYMAPADLGWSARLSEIWATNKRLIVAYNERSIISEFPDILWHPVSQKWANKMTLSGLQEYLKDNIDANIRYPWAAMAQLTATTWSVITDKPKGLRSMAASVNAEVTNWFRGDWGGKCNAVAVDFLRSTGIVEAAIRWNKRKGRGSTCD